MRTFLCGLLLVLLAQNLPAAGLAERVQEVQLANGLTVLLLERHDFPTVSAYMTFRVGSANEGLENRGVAHLLEHMLFKGTQLLGTTDYVAEKPLLDKIEQLGSRIDRLKNDPGASPQLLAELRAELQQAQAEHKQYVVKDEFSRIYAENGGVGYNAFTSKDQTTYIISLPANKLELWAAIESDRLKNAVLREFYVEREVVREERRRSYESSPSGLLYEALIANAFTVHPYRHPIIGWDSDIDNLSLDEARDFFKAYYRPVNMILTLVGDFDSQEALRMIDQYFGAIPPGQEVPRVLAVEPQQRAEKRVKISFDAEPTLMIAYHKPAMPALDDYCADLLTDILAGSKTSRLYRRLVVEQQLAGSIDIFGAPGSRYANLLVVSATPLFPHSTEAVEAAIYAEFERIAAEAVSEEELTRARNRLIIDNLRAMRSNAGLARLLSSYAAVGNWRYLVDYEEQISRITPADLREFVKRYLVATNRTVVQLQREVQ
jgi:predicted Zn-dependent peptidase